jgi:transcriptional regulator with XRE-family HTH domain
MNLHDARKRARMTQQEIADLLAISKVFVSDIERGQRTPSLKNALALQEIFPRLDLRSLLTEAN